MARDGDGLFLDIKAVDGLRAFAAAWPGPVRCLMRVGTRQDIGYGRVYRAADLPFEVVPANEQIIDDLTRVEDAAVILAAGDNYQDLGLAAAINRPVVYIIEYTLATRLRIVWLDRGLSFKALRSMVWTLGTEVARRRAFRRAAGLQANGTPAYERYRRLTPRSMLYFDTRTSASQQITPAQLVAKQQSMLAGRPLRLAFSGRLERMKGADHLIDVASHVAALGIAFTLDIFGDGALRPAIETAIARRGLGAMVRLRGAVPFDTVLMPTMIESVDLFLCCHRQADPSCTYMETLSCGVPIVGYDNAAFAGIARLGPVGTLVRMDDAREAARAVAALNADRLQLAAMAEAAVDVSRANSFEATFDKRIDHLRLVAGA